MSESKPYGVVYLITNTVNGKRYVGKTTKGVDRRMNQHCWEATKRESGHCRLLTKAIKKYGRDSFSIWVLQECRSAEELCGAERETIVRLRTLVPGGYNLTTGGEGGQFSEETRRRISEALKGHGITEAWRENLRRSHLGKRLPEAQRQKQSQTMTGRTRTPEHQRKLTEAQRGHPVSLEQRQTLREAATRQWASEEARERQRQACISQWNNKTKEQRERSVGAAVKALRGQWAFLSMEQRTERARRAHATRKAREMAALSEVAA